MNVKGNIWKKMSPTGMQNHIQRTVGFKKVVVATHTNRAHKYEHVGTGAHLQLMQSGSVSQKISPAVREGDRKNKLKFCCQQQWQHQYDTTGLPELLYLIQVEHFPSAINL